MMALFLVLKLVMHLVTFVSGFKLVTHFVTLVTGFKIGYAFGCIDKDGFISNILILFPVSVIIG